MSHANATLTPTGRLRLARCVVEDGWPPARAAERFGVSVTTARRWASRYREQGKAGMVDRSSRPHTCPHRTPRRRERRVIGLRVSRRWGPARIAYHLGMHPSTVHKILSRFGCVRLGKCLASRTKQSVLGLSAPEATPPGPRSGGVAYRRLQ